MGRSSRYGGGRSSPDSNTTWTSFDKAENEPPKLAYVKALCHMFRLIESELALEALFSDSDHASQALVPGADPPARWVRRFVRPSFNLLP